MSVSPEDISAVAALDDPLRAALYRHVALLPAGANRDQAARAVGISRTLAAYHLDRLAALGLVEVDYRRPPGRSGPGAGRSAKFYRRSTRQVEVSFPPRNYELAARLLVAAVDPRGGSRPSGSLATTARAHGLRLGRDARARAGTRPSKRRLLETLNDELVIRGFEPVNDRKTVRLRNCPFATLARTHADVVCGMNLELMKGVVEGLGLDGVSAVLEPMPGHCCVVLRAAVPATSRVQAAPHRPVERGSGQVGRGATRPG